ncbi:T9SS type A sorting domain-containing protein [Balneolaceae bacterium ANBcel3]|nr:T9SS type A sorting domain-containing protein [Balneolaceae bacterium ANBcel3]
MKGNIIYYTAVILMAGLFSFTPCHASGISSVNGTLYNADGHTLSNIPVFLVDQVLSDTLDYTHTNDRGQFSLSYDASTALHAPYPNPTTGTTHMVVTSNGGTKRVGVYDVLGRQLAAKTHEFGVGNNRVSVGPFPGSGVYLVNIRGENFNETAKLTSLGGGSDFSMDVVSRGGHTSESSIALIVDESEDFEGVFRPVTFGRSMNEHITLTDKYFDALSRGRLTDIQGADVDGWLVTSYAGREAEWEIEGAFEFSREVPMRLKGDPVVYAFSADGFEPAASEHVLKEHLELGDIILERVLPSLNVSAPSNVDWFSGDFSINASSVNELDSLVLKVEDKVYGWNINGNEVDEGVSHSFENTGRIPYTVKAFDVHGTKKVLEDFVDVRERHDFRVEARGFFDKNPNPYASIQARHLESGRDTTMVADGDGIISSVLPRGDYVLDIIGGEEASVVDGVPGMSEVNRLMVSENEYPVPGMFWHGAERDGVPVTYVVSGYGPRELENHRTNTGNVEVLFRLRDDFDSHMETVENKFDVDTHGYFIDEWSRFNDVIWVDRGDWEGSDRHPFVILPDVTEEQVVVFNKGNSAYGRGWNVAVAAGSNLPREDHPDGGLYLPGSSWNEEELENWEIFKEDMRSVLEDSLDINPFSIKFVEDYAENLTDLGYVNRFGGYGDYMTIADNVMYVGRTNLGGIENRRIRIRYPPSPSGHPNPPPIGYDNNERIMESSYFFVNGSLPSWYTNELNHFFSTVNEPNPGICSVKDFNTSAIVNPDPPSYCTDRQEVKYVDDEGKHLRSGNPKDFMVWMASAGFGGFPQQQISQVYMQKLGEDPVAVEYVLESDEWDPRSSYDDRNRGVGNAYKGFNLMLPKTE